MIPKQCEECGWIFLVYPYRAEKARFCSSSCRNARPENTARYKHGKSYRTIRVNGKRQYQSRVVAGADYTEVVHHKDHNPKNNVPENLERMSRAAHQRLHKPRLGTGRANSRQSSSRNSASFAE